MKKILILLLTAFAFASCNDDCDHQLPSPPPGDNWIVGTWYEEEENEEVRYSESGTFYDKYCNVRRSGETEGRYEKNDETGRLTHTYNFMGQTQFSDWTITNRDEFSFTIKSETVAAHRQEKVVETYNMSVGNTQQIAFAQNRPDYAVQSYTSKNERIASVSESGLITANGEKGTTYIKLVTNNGNVWVKVVVGDECLDLWYDYISLIGKSYAQVKNVLGDPHQNDGNQGYFYVMEYHDVINQVSFWLNPRTRSVETFNLILKEGVPSEVVLSYMESRYYKFKEIGTSIQFLNTSSRKSSIGMIEYNQESRTIIISDINAYYNLWPNFTASFGSDKASIRNAAEGLKMEYSFSSNSYSPYGSDYYTDDYGDYITMYGFVFNKAEEMFEYWAYMPEGTDYVLIASAIGETYIYNQEETKQGLLVWYNEEKTIRVKLDVTNSAVIYTGLTLEGLPKLPDYTYAFGMTLDEISETYGELYLGVLPMYFISNDYIESVYFNIDNNTGKTTAYQLSLKAGFSIDEIHEYLSSLYIQYGENDAKTMYGYRDGATKETSKIQVILNGENGTITYYDLETYGQSGGTKAQITWDDAFLNK